LWSGFIDNSIDLQVSPILLFCDNGLEWERIVKALLIHISVIPHRTRYFVFEATANHTPASFPTVLQTGPAPVL
jgi:hypothetical protein